jgi:sugar phosphate isomerase/epimerase
MAFEKRKNDMVLRSLVENGVLAALLMLGLGLLAAGCNQGTGHSPRIRFVRYPRLKLGFTTQNFINSTKVSVETTKKLIDYADQGGYHWIELRDPDVTLTVEQCRQIGDYAKGRRIEIAYASQRGLLDPDFMTVFERALPNAAVFTGPGTIRALLAGKNFTDPAKKGLTAAELEQSIAVADQAAKLAGQHHLQLVVENASEPLFADGVKLYGLTDFFQRADSDVGWQLDTGNFFAGAKDKPSPEQVEEFINLHADNLFYAHVKSVRNGEVLPSLGDHVLDFKTIFSIVSDFRVQYLAIELPSDKDERQNYRNLDLSLDYLQKKSLI